MCSIFCFVWRTFICVRAATYKEYIICHPFRSSNRRLKELKQIMSIWKEGQLKHYTIRLASVVLLPVHSRICAEGSGRPLLLGWWGECGEHVTKGQIFKSKTIQVDLTGHNKAESSTLWDLTIHSLSRKYYILHKTTLK